ncbi:MAG: ECF transporter S component [Candidatus Pacebacteria bacterium]|nr:ECF transporter S component [Candidatus Paceibacterota bacterium]MCF7862441.1 ECF transporter S component [Candidatus Paceibacterota bacterium]
MDNIQKNWFKYIIGFIACLLIRLVPFRPPNIEPVLATQMPFSKAYGKQAGFLFAFFSIVLYDALTTHVGMWTFVTAIAYGLLGLWASVYFKNKNNNSWNYAKFAVIGTLAYDVVTGLSVGPLFFHQSFMEALTGQIPFTALHLIGNVGFAVVFSPLLYKYVIKNKNLESTSLIAIFRPKQV